MPINAIVRKVCLAISKPFENWTIWII